jgi:hypothetical protein
MMQSNTMKVDMLMKSIVNALDGFNSMELRALSTHIDDLRYDLERKNVRAIKDVVVIENNLKAIA